MPLLALRTRNHRPRRGREQQQSRQNNNVNVRTGHAPYSRPWDNQPYRRCTRRQQALHARAYRKVQRRYPIHRLIHRRCASLDLETAFKHITILPNIEKEVCKQCQAEFCRCPAFRPGTPCSSVSSTPINTSDKLIPELVPNKSVQQVHLSVQLPSDDEEADREVAVICKAPEYYRVRSDLRRRQYYFMYNALDDIGEETHYKRCRNNSPCVQGPPVEH